MAQVGAWVPADSLTLTPVDAIFVRMGAKDDVMSAFFVELAETAAALNKATPASLVALDELGRGTATSDGAAIAAAVLEHLSAKTCCRCSPGPIARLHTLLAAAVASAERNPADVHVTSLSAGVSMALCSNVAAGGRCQARSASCSKTRMSQHVLCIAEACLRHITTDWQMLMSRIPRLPSATWAAV